VVARGGHEFVSILLTHEDNDLFVRETSGSHFDAWLRLTRVIDDFLNAFNLFCWQIGVVLL